jgi:hypothetical protein
MESLQAFGRLLALQSTAMKRSTEQPTAVGI